jgi:hypothetical protein
VTDPRVSFRPGDAQALPVKDAEHDIVVSGLMLNFVPDQARDRGDESALSPGWNCRPYVWDYAGEMQLMDASDAAVARSAGARARRGASISIARLDRWSSLRAAASRRCVLATDVPTLFGDFDDYWKPFLGGQAPAPGYCMSLTEERRTALRERIRSTMPVQPDGSIHLIARAWAVRGQTE